MDNSLWFRHDNLQLELPPLTNQVIQETEEHLKIKLPQSFIQFCFIQNGGTLAKNDYYNPKYKVKFTVTSLLGIDSVHGIGCTPFLQNEWNLPKNLVLISDEEEEWIALDYRKKSRAEPTVVWHNPDTGKICTIAKNFTDFIQNLIDPHFEYTKEELDDFDD